MTVHQLAKSDDAIEAEASAVLAEHGMTVTDAMRRLLAHVAQEKALPIELLVPNEVTLAALQEASQRNLPTFNSVQALLDDLHAEH